MPLSRPEGRGIPWLGVGAWGAAPLLANCRHPWMTNEVWLPSYAANTSAALRALLTARPGHAAWAPSCSCHTEFRRGAPAIGGAGLDDALSEWVDGHMNASAAPAPELMLVTDTCDPVPPCNPTCPTGGFVRPVAMTESQKINETEFRS